MVPTNSTFFYAKLFRQVRAILLQFSHLGWLGISITIGHMDGSLISIFNYDRDTSFLFKRGNVFPDLPRTNPEKIREIGIRRKTASFIIEAMNFHKENFLHDG